jgi:hypothetical protein
MAKPQLSAELVLDFPEKTYFVLREATKSIWIISKNNDRGNR